MGSLAHVTSRVAALGGNIHSLGIFWDKKQKDRVTAFRLEGVDKETVLEALAAEDIQVVNVWEPEGT